MLGRLRDAVADVRDAGSNATRWLGIDELAQAAAYAGSGNERWRIVGARKAVAAEPELECNAAAVECSISGGVRGHAALQALEQFAAAPGIPRQRRVVVRGGATADAATARPRRWRPGRGPPLGRAGRDADSASVRWRRSLLTARNTTTKRRAPTNPAPRAELGRGRGKRQFAGGARITNQCRGGARAAEAQLSQRRVALVRADEAARKAADDAETHGRHGGGRGERARGGSQEVAGRRAGADRRTHERRCGNGAREREAVRHARAAAAAADGASRPWTKVSGLGCM